MQKIQFCSFYDFIFWSVLPAEGAVWQNDRLTLLYNLNQHLQRR